MIELLGQLASRPQIDIQLLHHMDRQANRAGLVHDGPLDGLPDPPGRIGRETETTFRVEFLHCTDQPQIALLDQIQQGQAAVDIAPGDFHHQSQVAFDHALAPRRIAFLRKAREVHFLFGGQEGGETDFVEVQLGCIQGPVVVDELVLSGAGCGLGSACRGSLGHFVFLVEVDGRFHEQNRIVDVKLQRLVFKCHYSCPVPSSTTGPSDAGPWLRSSLT